MSRINPFRPVCREQREELIAQDAEARILATLEGECRIGRKQAVHVMTMMLRDREPWQTLMDHVPRS